MEFIQFYPLGWNDKRLPVWMADLSLIDFVPLIDSQGNEFLLDKLRQWGFRDGAEGNLYARDRAAVAIAEADQNGGAFLHFESLPASVWEDKRFLRALVIHPARLKGVKGPVRVEPLQHYFCGGIVIDENCHTSISGLYACGEVTGGADGANRIGGNALANIVTFGLRAGQNAAIETPQTGVFSIQDTPAPTFPNKGAPPQTLRQELQNMMWKCLGPIRNELGLNEALMFLDEFENRPYCVSSSADLLAALEMPGLISTARACAQAALVRKQSLGVHYREDSV